MYIQIKFIFKNKMHAIIICRVSTIYYVSNNYISYQILEIQLN